MANIYAEQGARVTYENLIAVSSDPCVRDVLRFLWEREVVHLQRFGEALNDVQEWLCKCTRVWNGADCNVREETLSLGEASQTEENR